MKNYVGTKIIKAELMTLSQFNSTIKNQDSKPGDDTVEGYHVQYPNPGGRVYDSWSPKDVFEIVYREITSEEIELIGHP